jgi:hypothetical protein
MDKLLKIALLAFTEMRVAQRAKGFSAAAVCAAIAFFTALGALACAIAALWIFLAPQVGPAAAALWSAFVLLLITAALGFAAKMSMNGGQQSGRDGTGLGGLDDIVGELRRGMSNNKLSVLLAALIAGLLMGRQ